MPNEFSYYAAVFILYAHLLVTLGLVLYELVTVRFNSSRAFQGPVAATSPMCVCFGALF